MPRTYNSDEDPLRYVFTDSPDPGEAVEVADGVLWLRMPMPGRLDHINVWLLRDHDSWSIVDTGIASDEIKKWWQHVYERYYPVTRNHPEETAVVQEVGAELFGADNVTEEGLPMMGAEDFSFYLQQRPGCFFFLGGAAEGRTNAVCHSTQYDFNDDLILRGVRCYLRIVEKTLGCELV